MAFGAEDVARSFPAALQFGSLHPSHRQTASPFAREEEGAITIEVSAAGVLRRKRLPRKVGGKCAWWPATLRKDYTAAFSPVVALDDDEFSRLNDSNRVAEHVHSAHRRR
jgi:hypothetical protein